jgi:hypothetical protein
MNGSLWLGWLLKQGGVILAPGVISWIWVIVLLRETLSNLLGPALIGRELLFEIPNFAVPSSLFWVFVLLNSLVKTSLCQT